MPPIGASIEVTSPSATVVPIEPKVRNLKFEMPEREVYWQPHSPTSRVADQNKEVFQANELPQKSLG